ncbi:hypothetical protein CPB86DRAFT_303520 [Serendipita vermifera]|nr:hypothetical protein CPB86DRAFT_303520 [Serendipita vermifera]
MQFKTSFVLAFIAATSAPSLAAPIPSNESAVEHSHENPTRSHRHVARSPHPAGGSAPKPSLVVAPKATPSIPPGKIASPAMVTGVPVKGKPKRHSLTLDLEPRSPLFAAAVKAQGTPKTPAPKSKGKQRRSLAFDDFQELEARTHYSPRLSKSKPRLPRHLLPSRRVNNAVRSSSMTSKNSKLVVLLLLPRTHLLQGHRRSHLQGHR